MRRFIIVITALACLSVYAEKMMMVAPTSATELNAVRTITVYLIKQVGGNAWSSSEKSAEYDSEANTIKVGRFTYSIYENRAYGQANDGRSSYRYVAGDYYFNL